MPLPVDTVATLTLVIRREIVPVVGVLEAASTTIPVVKFPEFCKNTV